MTTIRVKFPSRRKRRPNAVLVEMQSRPKEAYCGQCRRWKPLEEYRWGSYKCKACARAYEFAWRKWKEFRARIEGRRSW